MIVAAAKQHDVFAVLFGRSWRHCHGRSSWPVVALRIWFLRADCTWLTFSLPFLIMMQAYWCSSCIKQNFSIWGVLKQFLGHCQCHSALFHPYLKNYQGYEAHSFTIGSGFKFYIALHRRFFIISVLQTPKTTIYFYKNSGLEDEVPPTATSFFLTICHSFQALGRRCKPMVHPPVS